VAMDKAGKQYWNDTWSVSSVPDPVNPLDLSLNNEMRMRFHRRFTDLFALCDTASMRILEIGCAKSAWLPYFAKTFNLQVLGLDYSPVGCEMAEAGLAKSGVQGKIVCADLFSPPADLMSSCDFVVSFGVVEHFEDTTGCIEAMLRFVKPGGLLITIIPNMVGVIGIIQKHLNRPVYDIHQLIDAKAFRRHHETADAEVLECDYFMSTHFGVCNLNGVPTGTVGWWLKRMLLGVLTRVSKLVWVFEAAFHKLHAGRWFSPYVVCIARKR
jgi:SAM-dependent methyltransferase